MRSETSNLSATDSKDHRFKMLDGRRFERAKWVEYDFAFASLRNAELSDSEFCSCRFYGSSFVNVRIRNSTFVNCDFGQSQFSPGQNDLAIIKGCSFEGAQIFLPYNNCQFEANRINASTEFSGFSADLRRNAVEVKVKPVFLPQEEALFSEALRLLHFVRQNSSLSTAVQTPSSDRSEDQSDPMNEVRFTGLQKAFARLDSLLRSLAIATKEAERDDS